MRMDYGDKPLDLQKIAVELFQGEWRISDDKETIQEEYSFTDEEMKTIVKVMEELEFRELIDWKCNHTELGY